MGGSVYITQLVPHPWDKTGTPQPLEPLENEDYSAYDEAVEEFKQDVGRATSLYDEAEDLEYTARRIKEEADELNDNAHGHPERVAGRTSEEVARLLLMKHIKRLAVGLGIQTLIIVVLAVFGFVFTVAQVLVETYPTYTFIAVAAAVIVGIAYSIGSDFVQ